MKIIFLFRKKEGVGAVFFEWLKSAFVFMEIKKYK